MFETLPKTTTFAAFLEGKPDGILYELQERVIVERQPIGEHEEINGFLWGEIILEFKRLNLPYFIPKQALIKVPDREYSGSIAW
jgi:Uma2 family endonuclease